MLFRSVLFVTALIGCSEEIREKAPRFERGEASAQQRIESAAEAELARGDVLRDIDELRPRSTWIDPRNIAHLRLDQLHRGVPVLGGQVIVHVPADGSPVRVTDHLRHDLDVDVQPVLTEDEAVDVAREHWDRPDAAVLTLEPRVVRGERADHLTWRVALADMQLGDPAMPVTYVDAVTGDVVLDYDDLQTAKDRDTYDALNTFPQTQSNPIALPSSPARTEGDPAVGKAAVDDAHDFVGLTYDYYDQYLGRDSFDDAGGTIISLVEMGPGYFNAYWNGYNLGYGDGGIGFGRAFDIVAHEFTHAVTQYTADLEYAQQSGGLNEATSDIMAAVIEAWDDGGVVSNSTTWSLGEDLGQGAFRSMRNPSVGSFTNYNNSLGVHTSSGIANRAFVDWVDDPALTIDEAGEIWYTGLVGYMTPLTTFAQARTATQQAALDIYGPGPELLAVSDGWDLVDVPGTPAYAVFDDVGPLGLVTNQQSTYTFTPATNAVAVQFVLVGDNGDADLYVSNGATPTTSSFDCASTSPGSREICTFDPASSGSYTVLVDAWSTFSGARLYAFEAVPGGSACADLDGDGYTICDGDCDDDDDLVFPGAAEACNGVDDDCDGTVDPPGTPGLTTFFEDRDEDGYGDASLEIEACVAPAGTVDNADDCDDLRDDVFPGAEERCNSRDDDCDGTVDGPASVDARTFYTDGDGDGFGDPARDVLECSAPAGTVQNASDCDDGDDTVFPGAVEVCNGVDDDCDAVTDPASAVGSTLWYRDGDGDTFGAQADSQRACDRPAGFVAAAGDCDDAVAAVNPDAPEVCNGIDDNCDFVTDPPIAAGAATWFADFDGDGYGNASSTATACSAPTGYVAIAGDCDDTRGDVSPGAPEVCDPLDVDENCDGDADEAGAVGELAYWLDVDGDGFGDPATQDVRCNWPADAVAAGGPPDCDDSLDSVAPGADEVCDGIDQDCDGTPDDDAIDFDVFYVDNDDDGFGLEPVEACEQPDGTVLVAGDCDDDDETVNPDAPEVANDAIDQDCDGEDLVVEEPTDPSDPTDPGDPSDPGEPGEPGEPGDPGAPPELEDPPEPPSLGGCDTSGASGLSTMGLVLGGFALFGRRRRRRGSHERCTAAGR